MNVKNRIPQPKDWKTIKLLLDSGCSESLIKHVYTQKLKIKGKTKLKLNTNGGTLKSVGVAKVTFMLP